MRKKRKTYNFNDAIGRLTVIREDPSDVVKGFPYNKDVFVFVRVEDGSIFQYGPYSKGEPDHWMKFVSDEYKSWPVVDGEEK